MKPSESEGELRKRLGGPLKVLTPREGFAAMYAFYVEQPAERVEVDEDGDMLLYQWGVYDLTGPESFQLDITRQFSVTDEDEPYQLSLTFHYAPTTELRQLASGNKWCASPKKLKYFQEFINRSSAFQAVANARPSDVEVNFDQC